MKVRFQADADLNQIILLATIRREPEIDFQTAAASDFQGLEDPEVLARAAKDGRVLVTHDRKTMPRHFANFITQRTSSFWNDNQMCTVPLPCRSGRRGILI